MKAAVTPIIALTTFLLAAGALAENRQGDVIVRVGLGATVPDDKSSEVQLNGTPLPGSRVLVDDGYAATFTGSWIFADHWGVGLLLATPFEHDLDVRGLPDAEGASIGQVRLGDIQHVPPTLTVQWFPVCVESWVQPYIGFGVNYTTFMDESIAGPANLYFVDVLGATRGASLELDDSWGLAGEVGVDMHFGPRSRWLFNAAVWYLDIDSDVDIRFRSDTGVNRVTTDLEIDPFVYSVGIGYRF
ncbi:OmpW/AlkL family protein [Microbulbifer yueqingensis]|uniref:Outer membrane protein n=1 Tax=Microbulbifer yueqingensis TaxID=658219 RepID=A0A1G8Y0P1_9GAMM|nr:OmpW family outer membrane protein [Microbulbifer yueqingensis]SDJ96363.1 outer membrane protein [Microbulbifer yueqingensis]